MSISRLTKLEMQIMQKLWMRGELSIREIQEGFSEQERPGYSTIKTTIYRLEEKGVVRRVKRVGNFHIFAAAVRRDSVQRRLVDDLLALFGGRSEAVVTHLIESGKLTLQDVKEVEKELRRLSNRSKP
jgi:predicted transcriptional regulator